MRFLPYTSNILISLATGSNLNLNRHINNTWGKKLSSSLTIFINNETEGTCITDSFLQFG